MSLEFLTADRQNHRFLDKVADERSRYNKLIITNVADRKLDKEIVRQTEKSEVPTNLTNSPHHPHSPNQEAH